MIDEDNSTRTTGGGDFGYEIKDNGNSLLIQVNHYGFVNFSQNQKTNKHKSNSPSQHNEVLHRARFTDVGTCRRGLHRLLPGARHLHHRGVQRRWTP